MPGGAPRGERAEAPEGRGLLSGPREWQDVAGHGDATPGGPCPLRRARPQPYPPRREWGSQAHRPGCCHEQSSKPCDVRVSAHVLNTTSPGKLRMRVQTCCYFLLSRRQEQLLGLYCVSFTPRGAPCALGAHAGRALWPSRGSSAHRAHPERVPFPLTRPHRPDCPLTGPAQWGPDSPTQGSLPRTPKAGP